MTLFELLMVLALILVLTGVAVYSGLSYVVATKHARVKEEHRVLTRALQNYEIDFHAYPEAAQGLNALTMPIAYLSIVPLDPFSRAKNPYGYVRHVAPRCEWLLISVGPDGDLDIADTLRLLLRDPAAPTDDGTAGGSIDTLLERSLTAHSYDPTNGTHSSGDVVTVFRGP
jgi:hypothetical protein